MSFTIGRNPSLIRCLNSSMSFFGIVSVAVYLRIVANMAASSDVGAGILLQGKTGPADVSARPVSRLAPPGAWATIDGAPGFSASELTLSDLPPPASIAPAAAPFAVSPGRLPCPPQYHTVA